MTQQPELEEFTDHPDESNEDLGGKFPVPVYTSILIACIAGVVAVQIWVDFPAGIAVAEIPIFEFTSTAGIAGFVKTAFWPGGEYWRILTGAMLHGFLLHAVINSYAFYSFGRLFEFLSNRAHLAIVFLLAAAGGNFLSLIFLPDGRSVGASGGILGIVSYLAVYAFRRRQFVSAEFRKSLLMNIGFILVFGLVLYQFVDNYGHIGGLIVGALYGLIQIPSDPHVDPRAATSLTEAAGIAALGIFIAVSVFSIYLILA